MTRTRHNRRLVVAAMAAATALLASACSAQLPAPHPDPVDAHARPVMTEAALTAVSSRIGRELTAADAAKDPAALTGVVTGPALTLRTAQYQFQAADETQVPTVLPSTLQAEAIPTTQTWPRTAIALTTQPEDLQAQRIVVYTQGEARSNYQLWGWVRMFPQATFPSFPSAQDGTAAVTDSTGLLVPIADAVNRYADVLTQGDASEFAELFAADPLRQSVIDNRTAMNEAYAGIEGTYSYTVAATGDPATYPALRTFDGGALVLATFEATETGSAPEGAVITPDAQTAVLLGGTAVANHLIVKRTIVVAFYIPATGGAVQVSPIGAENVRTWAGIA